MSAPESQEDCSIYIEELKSDDPSLKLNAVYKLSLIGSVLGRPSAQVLTNKDRTAYAASWCPIYRTSSRS